MALKTQLISTDKGCEGIEHEGSIIIANTALDFANAIGFVLDRRGGLFTREAHHIFHKHYSLATNSARLQQLTDRICA